MKKSFVLLSFIALCLAASPAAASDWEEDPKPVRNAETRGDSIIYDEGSNEKLSKSSAVGGVLHGKATAVSTTKSSQALLRTVNEARLSEIRTIDAEALRFLRTAAVNAIVPPEIFRAFIEKNHPEILSADTGCSPDDVLVVKGRWDDSTKPLHSFGLKFRACKTRDLSGTSLDRCKILIVDCAGEVPRGDIQKIRDFVAAGGYLLSTDWALQNVIERAFPGTVQWNGQNTEGVITDAFLIDSDSSLAKGLSGRRFTWKLDQMSQCVGINSARVHIIARSSALAMQDRHFSTLPDPVLAGALAFEFDFGRGKVLHLVGHFDNCSNSFRTNLLPDPAPGAGVSLRQVLAANFITEALQKNRQPNSELKSEPREN